MTVRQLVHWPGALSITWQNGERSEYASAWLYHNDPRYRDPRTGQRILDAIDLPEDPVIVRAVHADPEVQLHWVDGSVARYPVEWLYAHRPGQTYDEPVVTKWTAAGAPLERFSYEEVWNSPASRLEWLNTIASHGLAILSGVPRAEGQVPEVAARIGWVRETNYGRVFDVRAVADPNNLAYTNRALGLHTDNPYRDPVPGLQLLHCLADDAAGGESLFTDGFAVAGHLQAEHPQAFEVLASTPVWFEFRDRTCELRAERSVIECATNGDVVGVYFNDRSIDLLQLPQEKSPAFYRALRLFARLLHDPAFVARTKLAAGELVTFDNRRVLHGRTAVSSAGRHLQGCYVDQDGLRSAIAVLKRKLEEPS